LMLKMKIRADLHNHLATTDNMPRNFNKTINIARKRLGKKGILGMINACDNRYEKFSNLEGYERCNLRNAIYIPEKDTYVLRGQEVMTKNGHILVLGLEEKFNLQDDRRLEDSLKAAKENNGIIIACHPFFFKGIGYYLEKNPKFLEYFDGIEVHNGEALYGNKKAKEFYNEIKKDYNMGAISSSDGHSLYEIGSSYTLLEKPNFENAEKLIKSLRKSIKKHKDFFNDKQKFSILGSLEHSTKLTSITTISKLKKLAQANQTY